MTTDRTKQIIATTKLNSAKYAEGVHERKLVAALARRDYKEASILELRLKRSKEQVAAAEKAVREAGGSL